MVDEIYGPPNTPLIALRYLDSDLLAASIERKLSREELKYVIRHILLALSALHEKGYVHSGTYAYFIRLQPGYWTNQVLRCQDQQHLPRLSRRRKSDC